MPRRNRNAKRKWAEQYSFSDICRKMGLNPKQRLVIRRYILVKFKKEGEN